MGSQWVAVYCHIDCFCHNRYHHRLADRAGNRLGGVYGRDLLAVEIPAEAGHAADRIPGHPADGSLPVWAIRLFLEV